MSTLSSVLTRSSYNFGDLISCLRDHIPHSFVECPTSNGGYLLLVGNIVVGTEDLVNPSGMVDAKIAFQSLVTFIIFSSESCLLDFISFLLDSILACTNMNCSSDLLSILLPPFGILKLEIRRAVSKR